MAHLLEISPLARKIGTRGKNTSDRQLEFFKRGGRTLLLFLSLASEKGGGMGSFGSGARGTCIAWRLAERPPPPRRGGREGVAGGRAGRAERGLFSLDDMEELDVEPSVTVSFRGPFLAGGGAAAAWR